MAENTTGRLLGAGKISKAEARRRGHKVPRGSGKASAAKRVAPQGRKKKKSAR